jgi:tetratricopeptide (TPR) repeat protein
MNDFKPSLDLGDDLLEPTSIIARQPPSQPFDLDDRLQSAGILIQEGLIQDAKQVLHKVLIHQPDEPRALSLLADIRNREMKELLHLGPKRHIIGGRESTETSGVLAAQEVEQVIQNLETDLQKLGFQFGLKPDQAREALQDPALFEGFCAKIEEQLSGASSQDWIDLGVAFIEMELDDIAARWFHLALQTIDLSGPDVQAQVISATGLLATVLIQSGKALEASCRLEPLVRDSDIRAEDKIELFYLMARSYELQGKEQMALELFRHVASLDPAYRDVESRLGKTIVPRL